MRGAISGTVFDYENVLAPFAVAVVTGGSSGIGKAFIERMAQASRGLVFCNLSRRAPAGLPAGVAARVHHVPCDLGNPAERGRAAGEAIEFIRQQTHRSKLLLINNSGFGSYGLFSAQEISAQLDMLQVNVAGMLDLTARLLPLLRERGGAIINVASLAAFQPTPYMATYGATKACVLHWSLALHEELRPQGIPVQALCPGPTRTAFHRRAGFSGQVVEDPLSSEAPAVVEASLRGLARRRALVVPGWKNRVAAAAAGMLPRALATRLSARILGRYRLRALAPAAGTP